MKTAIEIACEILAGKGLNYLILKTRINCQRAADDFIPIYFVDILIHRNQHGGLEREIVGREKSPDASKESLLLVEIGEGLALPLEVLVACNGIQYCLYCIFALFKSSLRILDTL